MDSFEFNKIAGAVLGTALFVMALSIVSEMIYEPAAPAKPGYVIAIVEPERAPAGGAGGDSVAPIAARLQTASVTSGAEIAKKCLACHTLMKGEPAKVGPNLFGIVGDHAAHQAGFSYSMAMVSRRDQGFTWSYDNLDAFLAGPKRSFPIRRWASSDCQNRMIGPTSSLISARSATTRCRCRRRRRRRHRLPQPPHLVPRQRPLSLVMLPTARWSPGGVLPATPS